MQAKTRCEKSIASTSLASPWWSFVKSEKTSTGSVDFVTQKNSSVLQFSPSSSERPASVADLMQLAAYFEALLKDMAQQRMVKEWYTVEEVAEITGKAPYTVREWCRQGRIRAKKKVCGRGKGGEWLVGHDELTRLRNEGLLAVGSTA
jgi:helix-turn-helix protein